MKIFEDGSTIDWVDRETLRYSENGFSVLIWVDYESGFFNNGRIIKSSSIKRWNTMPKGVSEIIKEDIQNKILDKVVKYYSGLNIKCRVE